MDAIEALLFRATDAILGTFGEPVKQAFLSHLYHENIAYSHYGFDFAKIEGKLGQFFGAASPAILTKICESFMSIAMKEGYFSEEMISAFDRHPRSSNTRAIIRIAAHCHREPSQTS